METIYGLFGIRRSRNRRHRNRYAINGSQERKEDSSERDERKENPLPPLEGSWTCDQPYRYSTKESPKDAWENCNDIIYEHDENLCRELKEEISYLLVVSGLFLAVVTAFTIESYKSLKEDKEDTTSQLLIQVVHLLNDTAHAQGSAQLPQPFMPDKRDVAVNLIWFLSLILSLVAVVMGTFCLQWVSAFLRTDVTNKSSSPGDALALRQLRFDGLVDWGVLQAPAILLLLVQASLVLFTIGLVYFLWGVNRTAALPTTFVAGVAGGVLYLTNILPFLQSFLGVVIPKTLTVSQCPYKSPTSWLLHHICVLLIAPCFIPYSHSAHRRGAWGESIAHKVSLWWDRQLHLFRDYRWQQYDELCRNIREWWGPQHGSGSYSYYLVRGIASAMEILVLEPNAVDIISSCIQVLRWRFSSVEAWEELFHRNLSRAEKAMLKDNVLVESSTPEGEDVGNPTILPSRIENLKRDFLNAHILQHLVGHSQKLDRILFQHRVELYVRIKNSSQDIIVPEDRVSEHLSDSDDNPNGPIGSSLDCPIEFWRQNVEEMSPDLEYQFLSCAKHLLGSNQFKDWDILAAARVVASKKISTGPITLQSGYPSRAQRRERSHPIPTHIEDPVKTDEVIDAGSDPRTEADITDIAAAGSDTHPMRIKVAGDPQPESLAVLYQHVWHKLVWLPRTAFSNEFYFRQLRHILGLGPDPPPVMYSQPAGSDSV